MNSRRLIAVVEGQTEQTFIREVLAPWLQHWGIYLSPRLVGKPGHRGGVGQYPRAKKDILALLKQESSTVITTMFDFYAMPFSWPGREEAGRAGHKKKASIVEAALLQDVVATMGGEFDPRRLIPYVQMYEYEALLFTKPEVIADVVRHPEIAPKLARIRKKFKTPEEINDSRTTAPSKRIEKLHSAYEKPLHGSIAAQRIGIDAMLAECPHFREWLAKLQAGGLGGKK